MTYIKIVVTFFLFFFFECHSSPQRNRNSRTDSGSVKVGAQVLLDKHLPELKGKRIGLVMNPTARVNGVHMLDTLLSRGVHVTALFAPEHGFRGEAGAGEVIKDGVDQATGIPVHSLYGDTKKPTTAMLKNVDLLLFDMQGVGGRFYTYNATLGRVLEAASENQIPVWVLDRPNPAGGQYLSGWILQDRYKSFVGAYPIPMAYGMTLGELAKMMIGKHWIAYDQKPELRVIPVKGWKRTMKWSDTGLDWFPPSPNLPRFENAYLYLGTVLFEGTNLSEGRGTPDPFLTIGSPQTHLEPAQVSVLQSSFPSIQIEAVSFIPKSIPGKSLHPKFNGEKCYGVKLHVLDYDSLDPVAFGVRLLKMMITNTEGGALNDYTYKLAGSPSVDSFRQNWSEGVNQFKKEREPYLIYD